MNPFANVVVAELVATVIYVFFGLGLMVACWIIIEAITPFSIRKEIEEDRNMAIAVLMGSTILAIAIIVSAVILS